MKKILAAVDFSSASTATTRWALGLAKKSGGSVTLLHMYHPLGDYFDPPGFKEKMRPTLLSLLGDLVQAEGAAGVPIATALEEGRAAPGIITYAKQHGFDLIVLSAHGQGGAARNLLGTTAERVVRTAPMPVLVVPPEEQPS